MWESFLFSFHTYSPFSLFSTYIPSGSKFPVFNMSYNPAENAVLLCTVRNPCSLPRTFPLYVGLFLMPLGTLLWQFRSYLVVVLRELTQSTGSNQVSSSCSERVRVRELTSFVRLTISKLDGASRWMTQITTSNLRECLGLYPVQRECSSWFLHVGKNSRADIQGSCLRGQQVAPCCFPQTIWQEMQVAFSLGKKRNDILVSVPCLPN